MDVSRGREAWLLLRDRSTSRTRPQPSHTAWWCGSMFGSNRAGPGDSESEPQRPARASASSVLYTVAKLIVGMLVCSRSKISCAVGCDGSAAMARTIAMRCGVSLRPAPRTPASICCAREAA